MQNGPILLRNGNNPHKADSKSKFFRTGMGYSSDGKLFLIATQEATNLYTFAQIFKRYGVQNAMYLDGFPRYQKYIGIEGRLLIQIFKTDCAREISCSSVNN